MALSDLVTDTLDRPVAAIRRYAISLAIALVAAIAAIIYAASALLLALELAIGPIWARAALATLLLVIAVAAYFAPRFLAPTKSPPPETAADVEALSRDQRIALIFEALLLGFSFGSRKPAETVDGQK